ncbi:hypothetical protein FB451DRAFT_1387691 [Mycena latifolia]|nr:hypothetical protein FB451DRAFT_1387691 [Mycena latifolia]
MSGLAHFHYFLRRHNRDVLLPGFALEMHRLQGKFPESKPDVSARNNGNLIVGSNVQLISEYGVEYGFTIRNTSHVDLFPYLFYFDPDAYEIWCWYSPENPAIHDPCVNRDSLQLFWVPHKFLKLFVLTEYLDLGKIEQTLSPLNPDFKGVGRLKGKMVEELKKPSWNAITVLVTMSRKQL